jgi:hypothetical protein
MIQAAAIHLMINTLPPAASGLTAFVLAVGMFWRSDDLKRFAMLLMVAVPLLIIPVYFTGHATVRAIGNLPDVPLELIGEHQESVFWTWITASVAGAAALFTLARYRRSSVPGWVVAGALLASLTTDVFLIRTAHLGGRIRHPEVRRYVASRAPLRKRPLSARRVQSTAGRQPSAAVSGSPPSSRPTARPHSSWA